MAIDPLGLAGRSRDIIPDATEKPKKKTRVVCVRADEGVTTKEKEEAVAEILAAARMQRKRDAWNNVE